MRNLAYTARILVSPRQTLFPHGHFYLLIYISSWVQGLLVIGYCPSPYVMLWVLHVAPAFQKIAKQAIISFVGCSQSIRLKDVLPLFH